jgi:hypothetical protein
MNRAPAPALFVLFTTAAVFSVAGPVNAQVAGGCKPVYDAAVLQAQTPHHVYTAMTDPRGNLSVESISTNDAIYMKVDNQWKKSRATPQEEAKETADKAKSYSSCQHIGDETVNGEAASVYTETGKESEISGKVWISKKRDLPLKAELSMGARHFSVRYDYDNIRPPAGAQ